MGLSYSQLRLKVNDLNEYEAKVFVGVLIKIIHLLYDDISMQHLWDRLQYKLKELEHDRKNS